LKRFQRRFRSGRRHLVLGKRDKTQNPSDQQETTDTKEHGRKLRQMTRTRQSSPSLRH
jgi:hypothetical protein